MKLLRVGPVGAERPAVLAGGDGSRALDLSGVVRDVDGEALSPAGLERIRAAVAAGGLPEIDLAGQRLGAPIARPGKIVCIGLNYADHAEETGAEPPSEPVVFMKAPSTVVGPSDDLLIPVDSTKTDYEVELGVVIGSVARYLPSPEAARACVAGYAVRDDVSERHFQLERGGQWDKGKSCETFNPLGPWLVTADEVPDPQRLGLSLDVGGQARQRSTTAQMIFGVDHVVWYLSRFMVLEPGDLINTGTPGGVALARPDAPYLREGDVVEVEIEGLGRQRTTCRQATP